MHKVLLGVALLLGAFNYALAIHNAPPQKDGSQNYCAGANLYLFGLVSHSCEEDVQASDAVPPPTMKREPGTPLLLALTFALSDGEDGVRACITSHSDSCRRLRTLQRMILLIPFLALILLVYFAGCEVTGSANLAATASFFVAFGTGLIEGSMAFLSEPLAAILILSIAWMLYRIARGRRPAAAGVVCGIALGLLALTKAIYFYFVPVLGLIALLTLVGGRRTIGGAVLMATLIAAVIGSFWIYRNHETFGSTAIVGRGDNVVSVRAAFTTMTWSQYWSGYFAFTPVLGSKLIDLLGIDPANVAIFNRKSPESFETGPRRWEVLGGEQPASRQQLLATVLKHWPMQLALIPLTIYRSVFLPVGSNSPRWAYAAPPARSIRLLSIAIATVISIAMMPAFLLNVVIDIWRRNRAGIAFHLPALYSVAVHSVTTHYIPRYNLPLFGIFAIELAIAAFFLWTLLTSRGARNLPPVLERP